jgi:hypothetical protein
MQLADHFDVLLKDTVNLSQAKLDLLKTRVESIYEALKDDDEIGSLIIGKSPQGSWAQRTIINPVGSSEFDADFMLDMSENPDWSDSPKSYINQVYAALDRHSIYKDMTHRRKCRYVQLVYATSSRMHVDIVPHLNLADGREVIVNRDDDQWEKTNPQGFTAWMKDKDTIANGNLRKVIRLMKYLRNHRNSFTGTRSILLTTLLGERVTELQVMSNPGYYSNVPTTLLNVIKDLDAWLQARPIKPSIPDPSNFEINFDHRWDQSTYSYFRDRIHTHAAQVEEAYQEPDKDRSVRLWQDIFGGGFKAPTKTSSSPKFPAAASSAASTVRRPGRAG